MRTFVTRTMQNMNIFYQNRKNRSIHPNAICKQTLLPYIVVISNKAIVEVFKLTKNIFP